MFVSMAPFADVMHVAGVSPKGSKRTEGHDDAGHVAQSGQSGCIQPDRSLRRAGRSLQPLIFARTLM
jgi:hypothetical protein